MPASDEPQQPAAADGGTVPEPDQSAEPIHSGRIPADSSADPAANSTWGSRFETTPTLTGIDAFDGVIAVLATSVAAVSAWADRYLGPVRWLLQSAIRLVHSLKKAIATVSRAGPSNVADLDRAYDLDRHRRVSMTFLARNLRVRTALFLVLVAGVIVIFRETLLTVVIQLLFAPRMAAFVFLTLLLLFIGALYYCASEYARFGPDRINVVHPEGRTVTTDELDRELTLWPLIDGNGDRAIAWQAGETAGMDARLDGAFLTADVPLFESAEHRPRELRLPATLRKSLEADFDALLTGGVGIPRWQWLEREETPVGWAGDVDGDRSHLSLIKQGFAGLSRPLYHRWQSLRDVVLLGGAAALSALFVLLSTNVVPIELPVLVYSPLAILTALLIMQAMRYSYRHTTRVADGLDLTPTAVQRRLHPFAWSLVLGTFAFAGAVRTVIPTVGYAAVKSERLGIAQSRNIVTAETGIVVDSLTELRQALLFLLENRIVDNDLLAVAMTGCLAYAAIIGGCWLAARQPQREVGVSRAAVAIGAALLLVGSGAVVGASVGAVGTATLAGPSTVAGVQGDYGKPSVTAEARGHQIVLTHEGGRPVVAPSIRANLTLVETDQRLSTGDGIASVMPQAMSHYDSSYGTGVLVLRESTPWNRNQLVYNIANETKHGTAIPAGTRVHVELAAQWRVGAGEDELSQRALLVDETVTLDEACADGERPQYRVRRCNTTLGDYLGGFNEGLA